MHIPKSPILDNLFLVCCTKTPWSSFTCTTKLRTQCFDFNWAPSSRKYELIYWCSLHRARLHFQTTFYPSIFFSLSYSNRGTITYKTPPPPPLLLTVLFIYCLKGNQTWRCLVNRRFVARGNVIYWRPVNGRRGSLFSVMYPGNGKHAVCEWR